MSPVPAGTVERVLAAARQWRPEIRDAALSPLPGGLSSLTFRAALTCPDGEADVVVKMAPAGLAPVGHRDVLRQACVMRHLEAGSGVPVARVLFEAASDGPGAPPFFASEFRPGDSFEPLLDQPPAPVGRDGMRQRGLRAAEALACLHRVPVSGDLTACAAPAGPADEVARWERALATVPGDLRVGADPAAAALRDRLPAAEAPVLVHGDFRLGNMLFAGVRLTAVIDWEIWSIGDPRLDLAWFLLMASPKLLPMAPADSLGLPSAAELLAAYNPALELPELAWFTALVQYRYAATLALIVKRRRSAIGRSAEDDQRAERIRRMLANALHMLGS